LTPASCAPFDHFAPSAGGEIGRRICHRFEERVVEKGLDLFLLEYLARSRGLSRASAAR
jgi:hypothetical protein